MIPGIELQLIDRSGRLKVQPRMSLPRLGPLLDNQPLAKTLSTLALVYRQCGEAHARAALSLAEHQVAGVSEATLSADTQLARDQAQALEWVTEHSWQLWQLTHQVLGPEPERMALLTQWRQQLNALKAQLDPRRQRLGSEASPIDLPDLAPWQSRWQALVLTPLLTTVADRGWDQTFTTPMAHLHALESGPAWRQFAEPPTNDATQITLSQRLQALWQELWHTQSQWQAPPSFLLAPGQVKAARGTLVHQGQVEAGRLSDYRIQVPTQGTLASIVASLDGQPVPAPGPERDRWQQGLELWLGAHCPCVGIQVHWPATTSVREGVPHHA